MADVKGPKKPPTYPRGLFGKFIVNVHNTGIRKAQNKYGLFERGGNYC